jgi:hypothetical protein
MAVYNCGFFPFILFIYIDQLRQKKLFDNI